MSNAVSPTKPALGVIWRNGLIAAVITAVVNAILFLVGSALGAFPNNVLTPLGTPLTIVPVILMSVVGILVGTLGYTILSRLTAAPNRWFTILAVVVLILMAFSPFSLVGAPMLMIVFLEIIHLVTGGAVLYFLTRS